MYKFIIVTYRLFKVYHCDLPSMYKFIIVTFRQMYKFIIVTYRLCINLLLRRTVYVSIYHCDLPSMYQFIIVTYRLCINSSLWLSVYV